MKTNEERLEGLFQHLNSLDHIKVEDIPQIDLYMDQVTTFMETPEGAEAISGGQGTHKDYDQ